MILFMTKYTVDYDTVFEKVYHIFIMMPTMSKYSVDYDTFMNKYSVDYDKIYDFLYPSILQI